MRYVLDVAPVSTLLEALLTEDPSRISGDLEASFARFESLREDFPLPFDTAARFGLEVDRLGYAFIGGYGAALRSMVPELERPAAFCVTEAGGGHPRAIECSLTSESNGYALHGEKAFVTFGTRAERLLVVAKTGDRADGTPELVVVHIPARRQGIEIEVLPATPFAPEIPHAKIALRDVHVDDSERLPGDGYLDYVKPFRTVEDIHVFGAMLGYLFSVVRRAEPDAALVAELCAVTVSLRALSQAFPRSPATHLALGSLHRRITQLVDTELEPTWQRTGPAERERWVRDRALLGIAQKARTARLGRAIEAFGLST